MKVKIFDKSYEFPNVYFSSDLHLGHKNICGEKISNWKSGYRTFDEIHEMDNHILRNFLDVGTKDLLVLLGDTLMGIKDYDRFFDYLNCDNIVILHGNHTNRKKLENSLHRKILFVGDYVEMVIDGQFIVGSHYPMVSWHNSGKGGWCLFGHVHGQETPILKQLLESYKTMDMGVDSYYKLFREYKPFEYTQIKEILDKKGLNEHHLDE